jgi:hypothetical protein
MQRPHGRGLAAKRPYGQAETDLAAPVACCSEAAKADSTTSPCRSTLDSKSLPGGQQPMAYLEEQPMQHTMPPILQPMQQQLVQQQQRAGGWRLALLLAVAG